MFDNRLDEIFKNKFFDGLNKDEFLTINTDLFIEKNFNADEMIIQQDTFGKAMYIISSGEVLISKVVSGCEIELARRGAGEYIGEMALFDNQLRSANVVAVTDVKAYEIDTILFFELFNSIEQIKINIIKIINSTIRDTGEKLGVTSVFHDRQILIKESELLRTRSLLNETIELKRHICEQKGELELINRELEKRNRELYQLTIIDDLTHFYSKKHFESILESEFSRSSKYNIVFTVLIINIDDFKKFNDEFGHFVGDQLLKESAGVLASLIRPEDITGRIGSDCAAVIFPHQSLEETKLLCEKITKACSKNKLRLSGVEKPLTVTIGVSDNITGSPQTGSAVFLQALKALKTGKSNGKNCFTLFE